ncbi:MAG: hypothetical protein FJ109_13075 [Deltaproteobacteria bacterium]|nr:hypothetical protein [Deltaproteobacteria bacterium]
MMLALTLGAWLLVLAPPDSGPVVKETKIAEWKDPDWSATTGFLVSPDGTRVAYAKCSNKKCRIVIAGREAKEDKVHGAVTLMNAKWSLDSKRLAYRLVSKKGERIVVDNVPGPEFESVDLNEARFSPESSRFAYIGTTADKPRIVVDGKETPTIGEPDTPIFSPDGKKMAYVTRVDSKYAVVADGVQQRPYSFVTGLSFGADGRLAYSARDWEEWTIVVDGQELARFPKRTDSSGSEAWPTPVFGKVGKHLAWVAPEGEKPLVVVDGKPGKAYDGLGAGPVLSPTDGHAAYVAMDAGKTFVVNGIEEGPPCDEARDLVFSQDGKRFGYFARRGETWSVIIDGVEEAVKGYPIRLLFGPEGHTLLLVRVGDVEVFLDGKSQGIYTRAGTAAFSPDGKHWALATGSGAVVLDGKEKLGYKEIICETEDMPGCVFFDGPVLRYTAHKEDNSVVMAEWPL